MVHRTNQTGVIAFSKRHGDDAVLVVIDLFPAFGKAVGIDIDAAALGLPSDTDLTMRETMRDELDGTLCRVARVPLSNHTPARILTCSVGPSGDPACDDAEGEERDAQHHPDVAEDRQGWPLGPAVVGGRGSMLA